MGVITDIKNEVQYIAKDIKMQQIYAEDYKKYLALNDKNIRKNNI